MKSILCRSFVLIYLLSSIFLLVKVGITDSNHKYHLEQEKKAIDGHNEATIKYGDSSPEYNYTLSRLTDAMVERESTSDELGSSILYAISGIFVVPIIWIFLTWIITGSVINPFKHLKNKQEAT